MHEKEIGKIVDLLGAGKNTVVVTGAGISTEAGIPDFRGEKGIYRALGEHNVMRIINIDTFHRNPEEFWSFLRNHFNLPSAEPSKAHRILAEMEKKGIISAVVTQNVDNLHQKAGNKRVIPVHGTTGIYICMGRDCKCQYDDEYVNNFPEVVPTCAECGGVLKPDVILFGEPIKNYLEARDAILGAQILLVIGSSLTVYPLAGFVKEFSTFYQDLIIINKGPTQMDHAAMVKLDASHTGDALEEINRRLELRNR